MNKINEWEFKSLRRKTGRDRNASEQACLSFGVEMLYFPDHVLKEFWGQEIWSRFTNLGSEKAMWIPVNKCLGLFLRVEGVSVLLESIPKLVNVIK